MLGEPARSAMVRARRMIREHARADRPMRSMRRSSSILQSADRGQNISVWRLFIDALQKTPLSSAPVAVLSADANRALWISRALRTRAAISALVCPGFLLTSIRASTLETISCMSIQSNDLLGQKKFITLLKIYINGKGDNLVQSFHR